MGVVPVVGIAGMTALAITKNKKKKNTPPPPPPVITSSSAGGTLTNIRSTQILRDIATIPCSNFDSHLRSKGIPA